MLNHWMGANKAWCWLFQLYLKSHKNDNGQSCQFPWPIYTLYQTQLPKSLEFWRRLNSLKVWKTSNRVFWFSSAKPRAFARFAQWLIWPCLWGYPAEEVSNMSLPVNKDPFYNQMSLHLHFSVRWMACLHFLYSIVKLLVG